VISGPSSSDATLGRGQQEVAATSGSAGYPQRPEGDDLAPLDELIRQTPGGHPISSPDELRRVVFETGEDLGAFLASVAGSRRADVAGPVLRGRRPGRRRRFPGARGTARGTARRSPGWQAAIAHVRDHRR